MNKVQSLYKHQHQNRDVANVRNEWYYNNEDEDYIYFNEVMEWLVKPVV